ncbi:MAG: HRDC domain-containing protein [Gammaproteobacteria bacterium]
MLARRPTTEAELLEVNGVGEKKLASYGSIFLEVVTLEMPRTV